MRTTLTLSDALFRRLKDEAHRTGRSFKHVVNETLEIGLAADATPPGLKPYKIEPSSLGRARPEVDLDRALAIADRLEEEAIARKIQARK